MTWYTGSDGTVSVGGNAVAEISSFEVNARSAIIENRSMGQAWRDVKPGLREWSGSLTCARDETNTTGQGALLEGAEVALVLVPRGSGTTGAQTFSGSAVIEDLTQRQTEGGRIEIEFRFVGNGILTRGTVT